MSWTRFKIRIAHALPRLKSLVWGIFALVTAWAYFDKVPTQLEPASEIISFVKLWHVWATAGVLLTLGALVPLRAGERSLRVARVMRVIGISIVCGLMVLWAGSFFQADQRGWVSGKNYLMFSILALLGSFTIGKDTAAGISEQVSDG